MNNQKENIVINKFAIENHVDKKSVVCKIETKSFLEENFTKITFKKAKELEVYKYIIEGFEFFDKWKYLLKVDIKIVNKTTILVNTIDLIIIKNLLDLYIKYVAGYHNFEDRISIDLSLWT